MGAIVKTVGKVDSNFTKIPNALIQSQDYTASEKLIVMGLLSYSKSYEVTLQGIANDTGLSLATVRRSVKTLIESGLLERRWETAGGKKTPKSYTVNLLQLSDDINLQGINLEGSKMSPSRVSNCTPEGYQNEPLEGVKMSSVTKTNKTKKIYIEDSEEDGKEDIRNSNPSHTSEDPSFEIFYSEFPTQRRGSKQKALELFETAVTDGHAPEAIVEGSRAYRDGLNDPKYHFGMQRFFDDEVFASASTARNEERARSASAMAAYERLMADGY